MDGPKQCSSRLRLAGTLPWKENTQIALEPASIKGGACRKRKSPASVASEGELLCSEQLYRRSEVLISVAGSSGVLFHKLYSMPRPKSINTYDHAYPLFESGQVLL